MFGPVVKIGVRGRDTVFLAEELTEVSEWKRRIQLGYATTGPVTELQPYEQDDEGSTEREECQQHVEKKWFYNDDSTRSFSSYSSAIRFGVFLIAHFS